MTGIEDEEHKVIQNLNETDKKIDEVSKKWVWLKHEYRKNKDPILRFEIKKKWEKLQKKMETFQKNMEKELKNNLIKTWESFQIRKYFFYFI